MITDAIEWPGRPSLFSSARDTCNQNPIKLKTTPDAPIMGTDVDSSSLNDGCLLQYDASSDKFKTRNELDTTSGTLVFNGGNF